MRRKLFIMVMMVTLLFGCSKTDEMSPKYEGRSETKKLQGADAVGYNGTAIRQKVDSTLNKADQHNESADKALTGEEGKK
jgi:ABC-type Zn uptake system ZnuABC Zn-binding protein ZnuA